MRISSSQMQQQGIDAITRLSAQAATTQQQVATGRRVSTPADDPAAAAKIVRLTQDIATRERYLRNADNAEAQIQQEEAVLVRITEVMQRVRELTLQAGDPVYTGEDRGYLGAELAVRVEEVLALANSKDAQGNYLFSGFQGAQIPFVLQDEEVRYQGDSGTRQLAIADGQNIAISDSGQNLFDRAAVNFQSVRVQAAANAGDSIDPGALSIVVDDPAALAELTSRRLSIEASQFEGQTVINVRDAVDGTLLGSTENLAAGSIVKVESLGISLQFDQAPIAGDRFLAEVNEQQGLLTTVNAIASALTGTDNELTDDNLRDMIDRTLTGVDAALDNILANQAQLGARLNAVDSTRVLHEDLILRGTEVLSEVRDIDFAEAVSNLSYQSFLLEAAQQSFVRVSGLSLFNRL
ncbi:MAG: flagellar hook-associated protein FlgL [Pseudomonadales bacterium]